MRGPTCPATPAAPTRSWPLTSGCSEVRTSRDSSTTSPRSSTSPPCCCPGNPHYAVATYKPDKAEFPSPPAPDPLPTLFGEPGARVDDHTVDAALTELAKTWADESNGRLETIAVEGDAPSAIAALGLRSGRMVEITAAEAMAHMAWAAASGGAHGRRRGSATGRARAWWAMTTLTGLDESAERPCRRARRSRRRADLALVGRRRARDRLEPATRRRRRPRRPRLGHQRRRRPHLTKARKGPARRARRAGQTAGKEGGQAGRPQPPRRPPAPLSRPKGPRRSPAVTPGAATPRRGAAPRADAGGGAGAFRRDGFARLRQEQGRHPSRPRSPSAKRRRPRRAEAAPRRDYRFWSASIT